MKKAAPPDQAPSRSAIWVLLGIVLLGGLVAVMRVASVGMRAVVRDDGEITEDRPVFDDTAKPEPPARGRPVTAYEAPPRPKPFAPRDPPLVPIEHLPFEPKLDEAAPVAPPTRVPRPRPPEPAAPPPAPPPVVEIVAERPVVAAELEGPRAIALNGGVPRDTVAHVDGERILVPRSTLRGLGLQVAAADDAGFVDLDSVGPWTLDEGTVQLVVVPEPPAPRAAADALGYAAGTGAWLDYGARLVDGAALDGAAEACVFSGSARMCGAGSLLPTGELVRGVASLTADVPERRLRFVGGDLSSQGALLGGVGWFGGVQVVHGDLLDPYASRLQPLDEVVPVPSPSTLEVWVDGQLTHRTEVPAGDLAASALPALPGAGGARVVLRDAIGREREVEPPYRPRALLRAGRHASEWTVGFPRAGLGVDSFRYGGLSALASDRFGLTDDVTLGTHVEAALDRVNGGVSLGARTPLGIFQLDGHGSTSAGGSGAAGALGWTAQGSAAGATVWTRARTAEYSTVTLDPAEDRVAFEVGASGTFSLDDRVSASLAAAWRAPRDEDPSVQLTAATRVGLPGRLAITAVAMASDLGDDHDLLGVLSLSRAFGARGTAAARAQAAGTAGVDLMRALPPGVGVGGRLAAQAGATGLASASAEATARGRFGRVAARYDWATEADTSVVGASGALLWMGRRLQLSAPIEGGIALVTVPDGPRVPVEVDGERVGRTGPRGNLVVSGLRPGRANVLSLGSPDVPPGQPLPALEWVVRPHDRSGAVVPFAELYAACGELTVDRARAELACPGGAAAAADVASPDVASPDADPDVEGPAD